MIYSLVLSDALYQEFHAFKHGQSHDALVVEKLLHLYKPPLLTNVKQLRRVGIEDISLMAALVSAGFVDQSLPDLCCKTFYKLILDNKLSDYPFVDINGDSIRSNYTVTHKPGEKRTKTHSYLLALLAEASWVVIHDPYIVNNWVMTKLFFQKLFPRKSLSIHCTTKLPGPKIKEIKAICQQWKMPSQEKIKQQFRGLHDRYLVIDGQIEIGLIERHTIEKPKRMRHLGIFRIDYAVFGRLSIFRGFLHAMKEQGVVALLGPEDVMHPVFLEIPDMRAIGT